VCFDLKVCSFSSSEKDTTKYFGCELGALTRIDPKTDRYIVNGSHDATKLQTLLDGFIKKFVLCAECDNPETDLHVSQKKGMITATCKACGHTGNVDMTHKLTAFILRHPPGDFFFLDLMSESFLSVLLNYTCSLQFTPAL
jgi:translation initiation factor 5